MTNIRWGRILLGALFAEVGIIATLIPLTLLAGEQGLPYGAAVASLVATFVSGRWVASQAPQRRVLHGTAVGVVAAAITLGMIPDLSVPYLVAHLLKVVGGTAGGFIASKSAPNPVPEVRPV